LEVIQGATSAGGMSILPGAGGSANTPAWASPELGDGDSHPKDPPLIASPAISTPFYRHFNAILSPFFRHFNAIPARHFNAIPTPF
jgi:hypothetical protein